MNYQGNPLVSIFMITYNHEKYIAQSLEGVLMQKTDFEYEIVIGEDCSTDKTREIILKFVKKNPEKFKLILHEKNVGMMANEIAVMNACIGKYIALCEGDDYWTNPLKLQKQVDFLEKNTEYTGCGHQSIIINEKNEKLRLFRKDVKSTIRIDDLIDHRLFHTASFIFKREIIENLNYFSNVSSSDRILFFLSSFNGLIHYINEPMCVYRKSSTGMSKVITVAELEKDFKMIPMLLKLNPKFPQKKYRSFLHKVAIEYASDCTLRKLLYHLFLHIFYSFSDFPNNIKKMPSAYRLFINKIKFLCVK